MIKIGYTRCLYDCCVYLRKLNEGSYIYLLLYVDDILIAAQNKGEIEVLKKLFSSEFEMKDLRDAKKILGMEIYRDRVAGKLSYHRKLTFRKYCKSLAWQTLNLLVLHLLRVFVYRLVCLQDQNLKFLP